MSGRAVLFATTNAGKLAELAAMAAGLSVLSLAEVPALAGLDVEEDQDTLEGNARKKALFFARASGLVALADDSGLFVDALGGRPGVYSARYAENPDARVDKLLHELHGVHPEARGAAFRCVLCLATPDGETHVAEGACAGRVLEARVGSGGFGYDPILFIPALEKSMGELTPGEKAAVGHRGQAFRALLPTLEAYVHGEWPRPSSGG